MKANVAKLPALGMEPGMATHSTQTAVNGLARQLTVAIAVFIAETF